MKPKKERPRDRKSSESFTLSVRIQPRASKNELITMDNGGLKIRLTAPPVDGAANKALVKFLSDILSLAKSRIELVSGHTSRDKTVRISGASDADVRRLLKSKGE